MSRTLSMQGLRGGVGCTTLLAGLGHALIRLDQRVLLVDMSPENLLGLHFNLPADEALGWARAELDGQDWRDCAYTPMKGLALLPYGRVEHAGVLDIERRLAPWPGIFRDQSQAYVEDYDWLLFDLPHGFPAHAAAVNGEGGCDLMLKLLHADPACHVRLERMEAMATGTRLLVNRYDPVQPLQRNLLEVWMHERGSDLVPIHVHEDVAVPEALAMKRPIGLHAADSPVSVDLASVALWCQAEAARLIAERDVP